MAATTIDPSMLELVNTLDLDKVPDKLHCQNCTKFLINAYKGICCDSKICEACFSNAHNSCPVCFRSPYNLELEICKPDTSARKTAKMWLKNEAKARAAEAEKMKTPVVEATPASNTALSENILADGAGDAAVADPEAVTQPAGDELELPQAGNQDRAITENPEDNSGPHSDPTDAGDDEVEIQVEPSQEEQEYIDQQMMEAQQQDEEYGNDTQQAVEVPSRPASRDEQDSPTKNGNFDMNNNVGFNKSNNVDFQQMMQMMAQNGGMGFNPMMGMPMGMNPMNMFGGGMNGMNGMNMGMNFNPNMFGPFQNNNMWQNSNPNAFSNGMGSDFNPGFNFNNQQNYPNGDFQSGYYGRGRGRGRGRARGGYGRGNFQNQNQNRHNNFQNPNEQLQYDIQNMQSQMNGGRHSSTQEPPTQTRQDEPQPDDDEFAPGGQEEVQEALGDDYVKKEAIAAANEEASVSSATNDAVNGEAEAHQADIAISEQNGIIEPNELSAGFVASPQPGSRGEEQKPIAAAYEEDLDMVMPPPTAPSGPSGRHGEKDYGFRARGHGRFSRSRGSIHLTNGHPPSPVRSVSSNTLPRPDSAGEGVVGAPTGPRAMREPPAKPIRGSSTSGGFQIMGRASMDSSRVPERVRSPTPNGYDDYKPSDRPPSRQFPKRDLRDAGRLDNEADDHDQDRRQSRSKRGDYVDHKMQDVEKSYSRASSRDRTKSHKLRREREKDKLETSSRHSSRRYRDEAGDRDYDMNDYGEATNEPDSRPRSHRKHRDEKYTKERERERDRDRDRDRDREKPRDKDRKRSRHDRDQEEDEDDHDHRYRSSKHHKKEHTKDLEIDGRSNSHRSSQVPTPAATPTPKEAEKDPYTLEREARQRERMLKEDQRREKAANAKAGGSGRRVSYKTEEDAQRGMEERESAIRAARWR